MNAAGSPTGGDGLVLRQRGTGSAADYTSRRDFADVVWLFTHL